MTNFRANVLCKPRMCQDRRV